MSTPSIKKGEIERRWLLVDAEGKTLGRLASQVAAILKGKHKPQYTPHADTGDHVVVINAAKVHLSGRKWQQKFYRHHSGYPGGLKEIRADALLQKRPERLIEDAVRRMLPRSPLGRQMMRKLRVYAGAEHPHVAQKPEPHELTY
ncbi:MAG: 50S ribosomal protein L13 [Deltaproteobacteria bacterium]|nr:MAG: 50S ribosomal protein L13 [Deltaproteobacteria bacterium]